MCNFPNCACIFATDKGEASKIFVEKKVSLIAKELNANSKPMIIQLPIYD